MFPTYPSTRFLPNDLKSGPSKPLPHVLLYFVVIVACCRTQKKKTKQLALMCVKQTCLNKMYEVCQNFKFQFWQTKFDKSTCDKTDDGLQIVYRHNLLPPASEQSGSSSCFEEKEFEEKNKKKRSRGAATATIMRFVAVCVWACFFFYLLRFVIVRWKQPAYNRPGLGFCAFESANVVGILVCFSRFNVKKLPNLY